MKYCPYCKELHSEDTLCEKLKATLVSNPSLIAEAANFTAIAGQYHLVTSQALNQVASSVNKVVGTNLSFEGTHQYIRDIQVFNQLNVDAYSRMGAFANADSAQSYILNGTKGQLDNLTRKLNGTAQEVDWLRVKQGKLSSIFEKSKLLGEELSNTPGVDGETLNRITGESIVKTTVKAAESTKNLGTNISGVLKSLEKGTLQPNDILVGIEGTEAALKKALEKNLEKAVLNGNTDYAEKLKQALEQMKVQELNTAETIKSSTSRLKEKMITGKADSALTLDGIKDKAFQGAIIGAAIGLTISSISNYLRYKKGEITEDEAFTLIGRDTVKGTLTGATMSTVTLFLPAGTLGLIGGMAIGIYLNTTLTNVLNEVFGKGAFEQILHSAGYTVGMVKSLETSLAQIQKHEEQIQFSRKKITRHRANIQHNFDRFDDLMKG